MHYGKKYRLILAMVFAAFLNVQAQEDTLADPSRDSVTAAMPSEPISSHLPAQVTSSPMNEQSVESISYRLYLDKDWAKLAAFCDQAIGNKFDYYFLRVRAGLACYELKQYRKAAAHFEKALGFDSGDDFSNSYLYYAYLYSERFEDARLLSRNFSDALKNTMAFANLSPVEFISAESGIKSPDSSRLFKNALFSDLTLSHAVKNRVFLTHCLTYFAQNESRFAVRQSQYYLKASLPFKKGFSVAAGFHLVNVASDVRTFVGSTYTHTYLINPYGPPNQPAPPPQVVAVTDSVYTERFVKEKNLNSIGALTLTKRTAFADYSIGATAAAFDTATQIQASAGIQIYPFKNNRLAIGTIAYFHGVAPFKAKFLAVAPVISAYLTKKIHICFTYLNNPGANISENTGSFVSNSIDYTTQRAGLTTSFNLARNCWIYGTYAFEQKKHLTALYLYDYNIFVLGLKIIPQFKQ